jgi:hypothetical protein
MKIVFLPAVILCSLLSCAAQPPARPDWAAAPAAVRRVFPDSEYLAQRGRGPAREAAETNAAGELARFISSQITANRGYRITTSGNTESINTQDEAWVQSQMRLFGVRYAEDAYYDKAAREWHTVAWIERDEAWKIYEPGFKRQADALDALFTAAENERDPFKKALRFAAAERFSRSDDFENANLFGQILLPDRMNVEFAPARSQIAALPQKTDDARRGASVFIDCPVDFESLISGAFAARFSDMGFPAAKSRSAAAAVCSVSVDEGMQKRDMGVFYFPSVQAVISGPSGTLLSFSAQGDRASAVTPDVAKRRAYQSLADAVRREFSLDANVP